MEQARAAAAIFRPVIEPDLVEQKHHVARRGSRHVRRWRQDRQGAKCFAVRRLVVNERWGGRRSGDAPAQHEVAIQELAFARQSDDRLPRFRLQSRRVLRARQLLCAGVADQLHLNAEVRLRIETGQKAGRADARGVGNDIGIRFDPVARRNAVRDGSGNVAQADDQRKANFHRAILEECEALRIGDRDRHVLAGRHVASLHREDIIAFLFEKAGPLSLRERLHELLAGLLSLRHDAVNRPVRHLHHAG